MPLADDEKHPRNDALSDEPLRLTNTTERRLMAKIDLHLLPVLSVLYLLAFLDRYGSKRYIYIYIPKSKEEGVLTPIQCEHQQCRDLQSQGGLEYRRWNKVQYGPHHLLCAVCSVRGMEEYCAGVMSVGG